MRSIDHWIDGKVVPGASGRTGKVWNPALGEQQAEVALASTDEVGAAAPHGVGGRSRRSAGSLTSSTATGRASRTVRGPCGR